jgi:hypothetical protein
MDKTQKIIDDMVEGTDAYKAKVYAQASGDLIKAEELMVYASTLIKIGKLMLNMASDASKNKSQDVADMMLRNSKQLAETVEYMAKEHKKLMERVDDAL